MMHLKDKDILLVGLGRSSLAAARLVLREGGRPFISEMNEGKALTPWLEQCALHGIPVETGGHHSPLFSKADCIVVNPGVPLNAPCLNLPKSKGIPILGELELASRFNRSTIIAVTGTNGKTTATTMLQTIIAACGHSVALAGNTHTAWSEVVLQEEQPAYTVLEVSSYQLETVKHFHPKIAVVLNLSPDHLGRHGSMENYGAVKARIFARQSVGDTLFLNRDSSYMKNWPLPEGVRTIYFGARHADVDRGWCYDDCSFYLDGEARASVKDTSLPGRHNRENTVAMLAVAHSLALDWDKVIAAIRQFPGVEHRLEFVASLDGIPYFNDSKSTNIDSLRVALESFECPVVLIAGGQGKGGSYESLFPLAKERVTTLIAVGEEAPVLEKKFFTLPSSLSG